MTLVVGWLVDMGSTFGSSFARGPVCGPAGRLISMRPRAELSQAEPPSAVRAHQPASRGARRQLIKPQGGQLATRLDSLAGLPIVTV